MPCQYIIIDLEKRKLNMFFSVNKLALFTKLVIITLKIWFKSAEISRKTYISIWYCIHKTCYHSEFNEIYTENKNISRHYLFKDGPQLVECREKC